MTGVSSSVSARAWLEDSRRWIEPELTRALAELELAPASLVEAMRYATLDGGKRLRPALARLACHWCGGSDADARGAALAVEFIHAYSLIHDDLPCMDDDAWRRGRPSCHTAFGEALALLAADALQTLAFEQLVRSPRGAAGPMVAALASAAGACGMVGGQVLDMALTGVSSERVLELGEVSSMHALKTGALIAASARLGALAAEAPPERSARIWAWGQALGRLFQATDDVLDVTADRTSLGKTPGKDQAQHKPTLVAALGLEAARAYARAQADEARTLARDIGGTHAATALGFADVLLDRHS